MEVSDLRKEYLLKELSESNALENPVEQFAIWMNEAIKANVHEPTAMCLSSVSISGGPSARIVLLKGFEEGRFTFYTNYNSRKGENLSYNPMVAVTFFWPELERQIRIEGITSKTSEEVSNIYFASRPFNSQAGAIVSPQSTVIKSREVLELAHTKLVNNNNNQLLEKPENWGGYHITPEYFEFWQGRPSRLHDRLAYTKIDGQWERNRLAP